MNSFGILDFALPFGAVVLVLVCWKGVSWISGRKAPVRGDPAGERRQSGGGGATLTEGDSR